MIYLYYGDKFNDLSQNVKSLTHILFEITDNSSWLQFILTRFLKLILWIDLMPLDVRSEA